MKGKILKVLGVGTGACLSSLLFIWYYPYVCLVLYFGAGVLARIIMVEQALLSGLIVSLPGVVVVTCLVVEGKTSMATPEVIIWYTFVPVAFAGSIFGLSIIRRFSSKEN
jgi:hypothetical protein